MVFADEVGLACPAGHLAVRPVLHLPGMVEDMPGDPAAVVQPLGTSGAPSEGAPITAAIASRSSSIAATSSMFARLSVTPGLRA